MKVAYDHQIFSLQRFGGISRYFVELRRALADLGDVRTDLPITWSNNQYLRDSDPAVRAFELGQGWRSQKHLMYIANLPRGIASLRRGGFDVFHPTYYGTWFLRHLGSRPFVLTVYDMIHERFPEDYAGRSDVPARKKALIGRAARIIAISENTKLDILKYHPVDPDKIRVIHLGETFSKATPDRVRPAGLPDRYILFVGLRGGYKNFSFFTESIAGLFAKDRGLRMLCVGGGPFTPEESGLLARLSLRDKVTQVSAPDGDLARYYAHAALFAFPSLYEGFGIPILEAFAAGCPAAISDASSFPEVAGDAAAYFDPRDADSIRAVVGQLLENHARADALREAGRRRLYLFDWAETARKTREVYREMCGG